MSMLPEPTQVTSLSHSIHPFTYPGNSPMFIDLLHHNLFPKLLKLTLITLNKVVLVVYS